MARLEAGGGKVTAVCSAMRYIVDPPKSPLKRGTLIDCTLLQRKALYIFRMQLGMKYSLSKQDPRLLKEVGDLCTSLI